MRSMANKKEILKLLEDPKVREIVREAGYNLSRRPEDLVVKTFKLPREIAEAFYKIAGERDLKVQDAAAEALADWISKHS